MDISYLLLNWFEKKGRDLPWRESDDPYIIWVSEIILQQTRIQQGMAYYLDFVSKYPDITSLANARISDLLNTWQGLGYYSRVRNMHEAAKTIVNEYNGKFPSTYDKILKLKGIGEYTAGAVASIAFNEAVPAIDGNVKRVMSRVYALYDDFGKRAGMDKLKKLLQETISQDKPGTFNQALMDLGAMICKPSAPLCAECPLITVCSGFQRDIVRELPVKYRKTKNRDRYFYYLLINCRGTILINQRTKKDIWQLMYEFPLIESEHNILEDNIHDLVSEKFFPDKRDIKITRISPLIKHVLSHQKLHARFIHVETDDLSGSLLSGFTRIKEKNLGDYPLPRLIDRYMNEVVF